MSGLILVHTGNGKGKTTAALGLSMRALGHNQTVGFLQFMKGSKNCRFVRKLYIRTIGPGILCLVRKSRSN